MSRWSLGGRMVHFTGWWMSLMEGELSHVTEWSSLMEGEWSCYRGGQL